VANLDLVAMCPAVPDHVPSWFGVSLVGGANTYLHQQGRSCWCVHICAMESWMSVMALVSVALVATRFSIVVFFQIAAFATLSREEAICCACSSLAAWFAPNAVSLTVIQLMLLS
jgi:hypothetical protein